MPTAELEGSEGSSRKTLVGEVGERVEAAVCGQRSGCLDASGVESADIDAAFIEFGTYETSQNGFPGRTVNNASASPFDNQQIYVWIFNTPTQAAASEHGLFTVTNASMPDAGNPWTFPFE